MFDLTLARAADVVPRNGGHLNATVCSADDRERLGATSKGARWLMAALDEVDYGIVLLDADAQVQHVNHTARAELDGTHPLQLVGLRLRAREPRAAAQLRHALEGASRRGLRKVLTIGEGDAQISASIVPLRTSGDDGQAAALLMLGKRRVSGELAVQAFARGHCLTPCETRVLIALCDGVRPAVAAAQYGVAISTVRSQIRSLRAKTGAATIRDLIHKVASLPPLMSALRNGGNTSLDLTPLSLAA